MCLPRTAMRGSKDRYVIRSRYESALIGLALIVFFAVLVGSCDEVERHKVLNYFFDGVPPLGSRPSLLIRTRNSSIRPARRPPGTFMSRERTA
jgi:hypothetical protein